MHRKQTNDKSREEQELAAPPAGGDVKRQTPHSAADDLFAELDHQLVGQGPASWVTEVAAIHIVSHEAWSRSPPSASRLAASFFTFPHACQSHARSPPWLHSGPSRLTKPRRRWFTSFRSSSVFCTLGRRPLPRKHRRPSPTIANASHAITLRPNLDASFSCPEQYVT